MSIFKNPLVLSDDGKRHEPLTQGGRISPDVVPVSSDKDNRLEVKDDGLHVGPQKVVSDDDDNMVRIGSDGGAYLDGNDVLSNGVENLLTINEVDHKIQLKSSAVSPAAWVREGDKILFSQDDKLGAELSIDYDNVSGQFRLLGHDDSVIGEVHIPSPTSALKYAEFSDGKPDPAGEAVEGDYRLSFMFSDGESWAPGGGVTIKATKGSGASGQFQLRLPDVAKPMTQARIFFMGEEKDATGDNSFSVVFSDGTTASITLTLAGDVLQGSVLFTPAIGIKSGVYMHFVWLLADGTLADSYTDLTPYLSTFEAGQGIDITRNVVSVKIKPGAGLILDDEGLALESGFGISTDPNNDLTQGEDGKFFVQPYTSGLGITIANHVVKAKVKPDGGIIVDSTGLSVDMDGVIDDAISGDSDNALKKGEDGKLYVEKVEGKIYEAGDGIDIDDVTVSVKPKPNGGIKNGVDGVEVDFTALVSPEGDNGLSVDGSGKLFVTDPAPAVQAAQQAANQAKQAADDAQASVDELRKDFGSDVNYVEVFEEALNG